MASARILVVTRADGDALVPDLPCVLEGQGHRVEVLPHGVEALLRLAVAPPDLVVSEVEDLARGGAAFARIVRERPSFAELPLIAIVDELTLREHAALLVAGYDRVATALTAEHVVPKAAADLFGAPYRVPSLLEAYAKAAAIAFQHAAPVQPRVVAFYPN